LEVEKMAIKRIVMREEIKNYLIEAVVRGDYEIGERLVETQIARQLGTSQAPVREAFRDLEQMGILKSVPFKGAYVRGYTVEDLKDAYTVRAELEGLAIKLAISKISDEQIEELENIYEQMQNTVDLNEQAKLDVKFHEFIVKASGNRILERAWKSISAAQWTYYGIYNFELNLIKRHEAILEAFREKNADKAIEMMQKHFLELKDQLNKKKK